jgi:hypothetical protein
MMHGPLCLVKSFLENIIEAAPNAPNNGARGGTKGLASPRNGADFRMPAKRNALLRQFDACSTAPAIE